MIANNNLADSSHIFRTERDRFHKRSLAPTALSAYSASPLLLSPSLLINQADKTKFVEVARHLPNVTVKGDPETNTGKTQSDRQRYGLCIQGALVVVFVSSSSSLLLCPKLVDEKLPGSLLLHALLHRLCKYEPPGKRRCFFPVVERCI